MDRGAKSMRDFAASLRRELKLLEDQIAADPRLRKAQKIRELLTIYEEADDAAGADRSPGLPRGRAALPAPLVERSKARGIWPAIRHFMRRPGSATIARSRLVAMTQSNYWANASPAWLQLQTDANGRPLTYQNVFEPGRTGAAVILSCQTASPANGHPSRRPEGGPSTANATLPIGGTEGSPTMPQPVGLVLPALETA
jgi:hypothetical protein